MTVKDYKGVKAVRKPAGVSDEDVAAALEQVRKSNPQPVPVYRPAAYGDILTFDFAGFCGGEQFEGGTASNYQLVLGSGNFVHGFEDQLVGTVIGEKKDVNITFPDDYAAKELAGKDAVFKCTVNAIHKNVERKLDEFFAREIFGLDSLDEVRAEIRRQLEERALAEADNDVMEEILDAVCEANPWTPDEDAVLEEIGSLVDAMALNLTGRQMKREEFYELAKMTEEDFKTGLHDTAARNLHVRELLPAIAEAEGITVTDEEREPRIAALAKSLKMPLELIRNAVAPNEFDPDIIMEKTMKFLRDNAEITTEYEDKQ